MKKNPNVQFIDIYFLFLFNQLVGSSEGINSTILVENEGTDGLLTQSLNISQTNDEGMRECSVTVMK